MCDRETMYTYLSHGRPMMVEQLQREVPEYLLESNVITRPEYNEITKYGKREDQITYLLDLLPNKTIDKFQTFLNYVSAWYPWIYQHVKSSIPAGEKRLELRSILDEGEVPPLPLRHVDRQEEYIELCGYLHDLKRGEYVVVHGMRGCGKSTLVSHTLYTSNSLVFDKFCKKVLWVSVGRDVEEFTVQLDLCARLASFYAVQPLPLDTKNARRSLRTRFSRDDLNDCLLILDDVPSSSIVDALDVGCKILITTDNKNIMNKVKKVVHYVKVSEGFTEKETLQLFSESIGCEKLPPHAKNIHAMCKGFPLTISLISSQLAEHKEDVVQNIDRWQVYESKLKEEGIEAAIGLYDRSRSEQITLLYRAIGLSIDSLDDDLKNMYRDFALFMDDVNIKPQVLCILWDRSKKDVIDIMAEFERKNLIMKAWNSSKNSYIYCVHDLLLDYLKRGLMEDEKKALHRRLIDCYRRRYGTDFKNFPLDDNYIFLYIGHHLKESSMVDEFPKLYLNLVFVEKKIMNYGVADLLFDLKKYKSYIANDEENSKKYEDFTHFIKRMAACKSTSNSDIVQFALCEYKESFVYKEALALKHHREPSHLVHKYFELLTDAPIEDSPPPIYYDRDEVVTAVFTSTKDVLVANSRGLIRRINVIENNYYATKTFKGHTDRVSQLQISRNNSYFLSASDDATIRVWNANGSSSGDIQDSKQERRTPSPQLKQKDWLDMFEKLRNSGEQAVAVLTEHSVPIKWAQFSNRSLNIVSTDSDCLVVVWKATLELEEKTLRYNAYPVIRTKENMLSCAYSNDDELVLCAGSSGLIYIYKSTDGDVVRTVANNNDIKSVIIIPDFSMEYLKNQTNRDMVPQVAALILGECNFYMVDIVPVERDQIGLPAEQPHMSFGRKRKENYVCAAVSWDGKYVAIATTNYNILVHEISTGKEVLKFNESNGKIVNLCWSLQNDMLLTCYHQSRIVKTWNVQNAILNNSIKLRQSVFDAAWMVDGDSEGVLITAALDNRNKIHVFFDYKLEREWRSSSADDVCQVCVCSTDGDIVYACRHGSVYYIDTNNWEEREILNTYCNRVVKLKTFCVENETLVVVLMEIRIDKFSLVGWKKLNGFENQILFTSHRCVRDFFADLENGVLYTITADHVLSSYNTKKGTVERVVDFKLQMGICFGEMKYCDISTNFKYLVIGNENRAFITTISNKENKSIEFKESLVKVCKFSTDEKYMVVGLNNGFIEIYNMERDPKKISVNNQYKFAPGPVLDVSWSATGYRFIVIFDRELSLYEVKADEVELVSILYMSVERLVSNAAFEKSVTIDSSGHFRVLQHPF